MTNMMTGKTDILKISSLRLCFNNSGVAQQTSLSYQIRVTHMYSAKAQLGQNLLM